ncbi:MAG TPA: DUF748 domain-containing protein [Usitatibacter sp.]|nr:DUF748 domain-containing protein [Usitatibacter sp.]
MAIVLAIVAALGFFAVPWLAKSKIEQLAASELGRKATVTEVSFNPFTLRGRITGFTLLDRDPRRTLLSFDLLDVNVSAASLASRALVIEDVRVVHPRVELARSASGEMSIQDLIDRAAGGGAAAPSGKRDSPFAVNNIEVQDGTVVFDDALRRHRTEVAHIDLGIPFLSGREADAQIRVKPHLQGTIDGAPFALTGATSSPFADTQRATLELDFDALPLARYIEYAPLPNGLKLTDGALTTRLTLAFVTWQGKPRGITLSGNARLEHVALARADGSPVAGVRSADFSLNRLDPLGRAIAFDRISIAAPEVEVRRLADGSLELPKLFDTGAPAAAAEGPPWSWSVHVADVSGGGVRLVDSSVSPPFDLRFREVTVSASDLASQGKPGAIEASLETQDGAHVDARTTVDVAARSAKGHFTVTKVGLPRLHPYYDKLLNVDVRNGSVDLAGDFEVASATRVFLRQGSVAVSGLDAAVRGERESLVKIGHTEASGIALDLDKRTVTIDAIAAQSPALRLLREADGRMHFERAFPTTAPKAAPDKAASGEPWRVMVQRFNVEDLAADFEDRSTSPLVKVKVAEGRIAAEKLDTAPGTTSSISVDARVGNRGRVAVRGTAVNQPLALDAAVEASAIDLVPFRPYVEPRTNVILTGGAVDVKGRLAYAGTPDGTPRVRYAGNVIVNNFGSLDRPGRQELVRWKTLAVTGADVDSSPFKFAADAVTLDRFYARLILDADAKLNVLKLLAPETEAQGTEPPAPATAPAAPAEGHEIPASLGRIQLTNGEVHFSDFFVKPNYSAHLTQVNGTLSALAPRRAGNVQVTARVEGNAPVDIRGTVSPFAKQLSLDLTGKATGVDLPPLTPYSVKYAGYGIQKGKLTMEVHYKVEDRKLAASNKLVLDQLTFGDRVESPTATKLPVLFLVSLLKDRNGMINLELPISGTLDDPQFSIWRVVVQIIVNLLTKAATAPFAILGAIAGGGEQLAYIEFDPGLAVLTPASETKLQTLAKALADRPALHVDAAGRAVADVDGEGLRRLALERALKLEKQRALAKAGESAPPLEEMTLDKADYAKYLKAVYRESDLPDKPRNFIGMQKDIPAEEMEKRLLAGYRIDENALRELANRRALAVKEWFTTKGSLPDDRVFVAAPKLGTEGLKGEGAPTRVDFALK